MEVLTNTINYTTSAQWNTTEQHNPSTPHCTTGSSAKSGSLVQFYQ